jgi:menaquinone-dependent protoporphyrinogen oxidase
MRRMAEKILVAFASKSGTTAEIAERIGACLRERELAVDVCPVGKVTSLEEYRAVVLGSGVRVGQWLPEALKFVKRFQQQLRARPVALFTVHMLAVDDSEESRRQRESYTVPIRARLTPVSEAFFAGRIELARLSFLEKLMTKAVKAPEIDARNWVAIRAGAEAVAATLRETAG